MKGDLEAFNVEELVKVTCLPQIFRQLDDISDMVSSKVSDLIKLDVSEDNKSEIKKYRSQLNSVKTKLETRRKEIKKEIEKPYNEFNDYYNEKVLSVIDNGLSNLDLKIKSVEEQQLHIIKDTLNDFFNEYAINNNIENYVSFDKLEIKINLSRSMKSMKDEIIEFCQKVSDGIDLINGIETEEDKPKILNTFLNNGYDIVKAINQVKEEKKKLEELQSQLHKTENVKKEEAKIIETVDEVIAPVEIDEEIYTVIFSVTSTKTKIKLLKEFMNTEGINYD